MRGLLNIRHGMQKHRNRKKIIIDLIERFYILANEALDPDVNCYLLIERLLRRALIYPQAFPGVT
jgi:hypothetical protein